MSPKPVPAGVQTPAPNKPDQSTAASPARITRDDLIRMGRGAGGPWAFVPLAMRLLKLTPSDHEVRLLLAANYAKLGLATCAREQLDQLDQALGPTKEVSDLRQACVGLPGDRATSQSLVDLARSNAIALAERLGEHVLLTFQSWTEGAKETQVFRTLGGELVRRDGQVWTLWGAHREHAAALVQNSVPPRSEASRSPGVVEGIDPPWMALALAQAMPRSEDGYTPLLSLVCVSMQEVFRGFMLSDLRELILDSRTRWFIGPDAAERFADDLRERRAYACAGSVAIASQDAVRCVPDVREVVAEAGRAQKEELIALSRRVQQRYHARTKEYWSARYAHAARAESGSAPALRVFIPTTRFSTFLKHSAADLGQAFESIGARVLLHQEPDDHSRTTGIAFLRCLDEFDPDLVVSINYTRATLNAHVAGDQVIYPPTLPMVTWVQDAMPHLFRRSTGAAMGEYDFLAGHLHQELFKTFGYPRARRVFSPVLASTTKFHRGPVDSVLRREHECEMAMVTHHSQTPETLMAHIRGMPGVDGAMRTLIDEVGELVRNACTQCWQRDSFSKLDEEVLAIMRTHGREQDDTLRSVLLNQVARPLADRILRHQTLEWAAEIAERRNWRMHIYGKGWNQHPTLAKYARGEIHHGEDLRAAYQSAAVHLHASVNWYLHQRVMECALSGGLPAIRLKQSDMTLIYCHTVLSMTRDCTPDRVDTLGRPIVPMINHPLGMRYGRLLQAQGVTITGEFVHDSLPLADPFDFGGLMLNPPEAVWLMGDPVESCFWDRQGLERVVENAVTRPAWRQNISKGMSDRVRDHLSFTSFASRIVDMVGESLSSGGGNSSTTDKPPQASRR